MPKVTTTTNVKGTKEYKHKSEKKKRTTCTCCVIHPFHFSSSFPELNILFSFLLRVVQFDVLYIHFDENFFTLTSFHDKEMVLNLKKRKEKRKWNLKTKREFFNFVPLIILVHQIYRSSNTKTTHNLQWISYRELIHVTFSFISKYIRSTFLQA